MAGLYKIKTTETIGLGDLAQIIKSGWDTENNGCPEITEVSHRKYIGIPASAFFLILIYPERNKVIVQSYPYRSQLAFTREGKADLKEINHDVLPRIVEAVRDLLGDKAVR